MKYWMLSFVVRWAWRQLCIGGLARPAKARYRSVGTGYGLSAESRGPPSWKIEFKEGYNFIVYFFSCPSPLLVVVAFDVGLKSLSFLSAHSTSFVPYRSLSARKSLLVIAWVKGKFNL